MKVECSEVRPLLSNGFLAIAAASALAGVCFELLRMNEAAPAWAYFTVWSALSFVAGFALSPNSRAGRVLLRSGSAGLLLSALVYWPLIAPVVPPMGFTSWAASTLLHAVAPTFVCAATVSIGRRWRLRTSERGWTYMVPGVYLTGALAGQLFGLSAPYKYLSYTEVGLWAVVAAAGASMGYICVERVLHRQVDC